MRGVVGNAAPVFDFRDEISGTLAWPARSIESRFIRTTSGLSV